MYTNIHKMKVVMCIGFSHNYAIKL